MSEGLLVLVGQTELEKEGLEGSIRLGPTPEQGRDRRVLADRPDLAAFKADLEGAIEQAGYQFMSHVRRQGGAVYYPLGGTANWYIGIHVQETTRPAFPLEELPHPFEYGMQFEISWPEQNGPFPEELAEVFIKHFPKES